MNHGEKASPLVSKIWTEINTVGCSYP